MKYQIALIGDQYTVDKLEGLVAKEALNIQTYRVIFDPLERFKGLLPRVEAALSACDGVLYTDAHYFKQCSTALRHTLPARHLVISPNDLLTGLFKASLDNAAGCLVDIKNLSVDAFSREMILASYVGLGIDQAKVSIIQVPLSQGQFNHKELALAHAANHRDHGCLCITAFSNIYEELLRLGVPVALVKSGREALLRELRSLLLMCQLKRDKHNEIVVIYTYLRIKDGFFVSNENQTQEIMEINHVYELLALFSQEIDGALFTLSNNECVIVCNNQLILEQTTEQYTNFSLIRDVSRETMFHMSVGIGYGDTVLQSRQNAIIGVNHAILYGGNRAFLVYDPRHIIGPLGVPSEDSESANLIYDEYLTQVAKVSGLSINTIYKLRNIAVRKRGRAFTANELAELMQVTPRTVCRIIEKLETQGYVAVIGRHVIGKRGRPSRIIRIDF